MVDGRGHNKAGFEAFYLGCFEDRAYRLTVVIYGDCYECLLAITACNEVYKGIPLLYVLTPQPNAVALAAESVMRLSLACVLTFPITI